MVFCHFKATHEPWDFPERNKDLYEDIVFPSPEDMLEFDWRASGRTFAGQQLENLAERWEKATKRGTWWCAYSELPFQREGEYKEEDHKQTYQKLIKDYLRCAAAIDQNIGRLLDYLDLLADYTGIKAPALSQGASFRKNLKGNTPNYWRESMYYRYWTQEKIRFAHFGIRNGRYKLMFIYGMPLDHLWSAPATSPPSWGFYD